MDTGLLKLVRTLTDREKIKPNKRLTAFLVCLFVSSLFWFLNSLSHKYTETINIPVTYTNLPKDKFLINKLPEKILLKIIQTPFISNLEAVKISLLFPQELKEKQFFIYTTKNYLVVLDRSFKPPIQSV